MTLSQSEVVPSHLLSLDVPASGAGGNGLREAAEPGPVVRCPNLLQNCLLGLLEAAPGLVIVSNRKGRVLYMNTMGRFILGVGQAENMLTRAVREFYPPDAYRQLLDCAIPQAMVTGFWRGETTLVGRDGEEVPVSQILMAHELEQPGRKPITVFSSIAWDLREHKRTEEELRHRATHDPLTELPNRSLLLDRLGQALRTAQRHGQYVAVLFLDLNDFKRVNDELGHEAGDGLLRLLAQRLRQSVRAEDTVARYGGDEFVIVVPDLLEARDYARVLTQIHGALEAPFVLANERLQLSASVGVAVYPDDGLSADSLLQRADAMMYRAKPNVQRAAPAARSPAVAGRVA